MRFDFDGLDTTVADKLMADLEAALPALNGKTFNDYTVSDAAPFIYNDPVDGSSTKNGLVIKFSDGSRIVYRLSGTGSSGATLRVYLEKYEVEKLREDPQQTLKQILEVAMNIAEITPRTGKLQADVIT